MDCGKKLPKSFFEKVRPVAPKDSLKEILPFKFTNEQQVRNGDYKGKKIIKLAK